MLSTELHRRTSLTPDGRPEKGGETPGRTTSKVLEFRQYIFKSMGEDQRPTEGAFLG